MRRRADIVHFSERDYARFSREFERASTEEILKHDPRDTVVLANDVSEGPDFAALRDYRIFTIYHVDVVAYVADIYFRGLVRAGNHGAMVSAAALGCCPRFRGWFGRNRRRAFCIPAG